MIEFRDIHKSYNLNTNPLHVLKGINLSVDKGEMVAIMGASGSREINNAQYFRNAG